MASVVGGLTGRDPSTGAEVGGATAVVMVAGAVANPPGAPAIEITAGRAALGRLMQGQYVVMAGKGSPKAYRAAQGLPGNAADWAYVTSKEVWEHQGYKYQAHWAINLVTGATANAKLTTPFH